MISPQQKRTLFKKLSEKLQEAISSEESSESVEAIATKFLLSEDQKNSLESRIILFMMGLENKEEFTANLEKNLTIDKEKSWAIYEEASRLIFDEIQTDIEQAKENYKAFLSSQSSEASPSIKEVSAKKLPPFKNFLVNGDDHLLEDAEGNKDNVSPVIPPNLPGLTPITSSVEDKLSALVDQKKEGEKDEDFAQRKAAIEAGDKIVQRAYSEKPDPYREPIG